MASVKALLLLLEPSLLPCLSWDLVSLVESASLSSDPRRGNLIIGNGSVAWRSAMGVQLNELLSIFQPHSASSELREVGAADAFPEQKGGVADSTKQ